MVVPARAATAAVVIAAEEAVAGGGRGGVCRTGSAVRCCRSGRVVVERRGSVGKFVLAGDTDELRPFLLLLLLSSAKADADLRAARRSVGAASGGRWPLSLVVGDAVESNAQRRGGAHRWRLRGVGKGRVAACGAGGLVALARGPALLPSAALAAVAARGVQRANV